MAQSLIFVTAHARAEAKLELDWPSLGMSNATLAVYMGRSAAQEIAQNLTAGGRRPGTPVIVTANVSLASERLIRGTLASLPFLVRTISDDDPTLLLIGDAVGRQGCLSSITSILGSSR